MYDKIKVELQNVQITLLLPLWGRAIETRKEKPLLIDNTAVQIIEQIDYDFDKIAKNIHPISQFEWIARSIHIDRTIKGFLNNYPKATIVNIGCGLDTTFSRIDNGELFWYDLDLPDVIDLRRQFIPESDRRRFIPCSFLDVSWFDQIHIEENVMFVAAGILYYFEEDQMKEIFSKMSSFFPRAEIIFDAASSFGIKTANKKVIESSGLDEKSYLKWGLDSAIEIPKWNNNIELVEEYLMFKKMMKGQNFRNKITAMISDHYKIMYMVHLRFR